MYFLVSIKGLKNSNELEELLDVVKKEAKLEEAFHNEGLQTIIHLGII